MVKVKAEIELYSGENKRKTPFVSGYRPLFDIIGETKLSGMIDLIDRTEFSPGEKGIVEIRFLVNDLQKGLEFHFFEALEPLGEGYILEICD